MLAWAVTLTMNVCFAVSSMPSLHQTSTGMGTNWALYVVFGVTFNVIVPAVLVAVLVSPAHPSAAGAVSPVMVGRNE